MSIPHHLTASLASRYRLDRELGGGGMARVFVATELALGREVVIKCIADDDGSTASRQRFVREIAIAARLQHPNIVPLLTAGVADTLLWYAMPLVRGRSLRDRLTEGRIPAVLVRQWLADVARALAHAHEAGIVHRDIKPENVLLSDDVAVVTDFGIAKAIDSMHAPDAGLTLTQAGAGIGTPAYMAPEQVAGESQVDARADLYAFGLLAWELFQGQHPYADARTAQQLMIAQLTQVPAALELGEPLLEATLSACLAKDPEARPASAQTILHVLRGAAGSEQRPVLTPPVPTRMPSVAVLPFANVGGDASVEYLSDGITDEILGTLGRLPGIRVASRASCFAFKGQGLSLRQIAERLQVSSIVEGSVRCAGPRVRVQAQLLDVETGFQQWSDRYDGELDDVFALQDEIARRVSGALSTRLTPVNVATPVPTRRVHPIAYQRYLQATHLLRGHVDAARYAEGQALVEEAIRLDPTFAPALSALGVVRASQATYGIGDLAAHMGAAQRAFRDALAIDPEYAEAWSNLGVCAGVLDRDWEEAQRYSLRAVQLAPRDGNVLGRCGLVYFWCARFREALRLARAALAVDPVSAGSVVAATNLLKIMGYGEEAVPFLEALIHREPENGLAWFLYAQIRQRQGHLDEALRHAEQCMRVSPKSAASLSVMARSLALLGRLEDARKLARELESWDGPQRSLASWIAAAWSEVDEERLLYWFEESVRRREYWAPHILFLQIKTEQRTRPEYQSLLHRVFGRDPGTPPNGGLDDLVE